MFITTTITRGLNNNKTIKVQTQEEIEQQEEEKREKRELKLQKEEYGKYFIVVELNELYNNGRDKAVINFLKKKQTITINGKREIDPVIENCLEIINTKGVVTMLRILNNQYLRSCIETKSPGRNDKIKQLKKQKQEPSRKEIENEAINWMIINSMKKK